MNPHDGSPEPAAMRRTIGIPGATALGLGSILGTGVFISLGMAAELSGNWILLAIGIALLLAVFNGLSSAQLAAAYPVSGGTYEYGTRLLSPSAGFSAGWLFLCAKSASAASAALGASIYLLALWGTSSRTMVIVVAMAVLLLATMVVLLGLRRTNLVNMVIVTSVIGGLCVFLISCLEPAADAATEVTPSNLSGVPEAVAIVFVAFTGYGRVATLGEEIRDPARSIPRAVILTLCIAGGLYLLVGAALAWAAPATDLVAAEVGTSSLERVARHNSGPVAGSVVAITAIIAMIGVLLNLLLGLSRVTLAMSRRGDMPGSMAVLDARTSTPTISVISIACIIAVLVLIGNIAFAWTLSALTVLVYYAITNLAALKLSDSQRRYPRWTAISGLLLCVAAACSLPLDTWIAGVGVLACGFVWRWLRSLARAT